MSSFAPLATEYWTQSEVIWAGMLITAMILAAPERPSASSDVGADFQSVRKGR